MKIKTNVSVVAAAAVTLLMTTLLFKDTSATGRQWEMITDKEAAAGGGLTLWHSLGTGLSNSHVPTPPHESSNGQPNGDFPKPPPPHKSSNVSAAARSHGPLPKVSKPPEPNKNRIFSKAGVTSKYCHDPNVPCPRPPRRERGVKMNNEEELTSNDHTSVNAGKEYAFKELTERSSMMID